MPNRIIKDSIRTSKTVNAMTDFQFRLWAYLITYVDDYGRGSADPEILKGFVFPRRKGVTESQIHKGLTDLANIGTIQLYEIEGESYFCFLNWGEHQRIQTKKSKFPAPNEESHGESRWVTVGHGESPPESESNPNTNPNPNPNPNPRDNARARKDWKSAVRNWEKSGEEAPKMTKAAARFAYTEQKPGTARDDSDFMRKLMQEVEG